METYKGKNGTVWYGFVLGYMSNPTIDIVGFAHTHSAYPQLDGTWRTYDLGPSIYDLALFNMEGIDRLFIGNVWNGIDKHPDYPHIPYNRYEFGASGNTIRIYP